MKLAELNPEVEEREGVYYLSFDCPCGRKECHRRIRELPCIRNGQAPPSGWTGPWWQADGELGDWDSVTLHPSINFMDEHWHGFVTNGEVTNAGGNSWE